MNQTGSSAVLRLMRDLKEWQMCKKEYPCINACPLDENMFEWHCNICPNSGDFKDVIFHLILYFDNKYPITNPSIKLCTSIKHPNVFDGWICLDMIKSYKFKKGRYHGWTSGYSVTSILQQLELFFLVSRKEYTNDFSGDIEKAFDDEQFNKYDLTNIKSFVCNKCNHCYTKPFPLTLSMYDDNINDNQIHNENDTKIDDQMKERQVEFPSCWFHRTTELPHLGMLCLGYGVYPIFFCNENSLNNELFSSSKKKSYKIRRQIGNLTKIKSFSITFDLISNNAFEYFGIRKSLFGKRNFTSFIPIYLNDQHGKLAIKEMDKFILNIWNDANRFIYNKGNKGNKGSKDTNNDYKEQTKCHPWLKLHSIANIMNSLIISLMKYSEFKNGNISKYYCSKILETFFRLHHTLIGIYFYFEKEISLLLQEQIKLFFEKDNATGKYTSRNKENIPDFGIFMMYLTLWDQQQQVKQSQKGFKTPKAKKWYWIGMELLDELFTRQIKNTLDINGNLINSNYCSNEDRATFTFKHNRESNNLFMFYCFFLNKCCKLGNNNIGNEYNKTLKEQLEDYNTNYGIPKDNDILVSELHKFTLDVSNKVMNFEDFFDMINIKCPSIKKIGSWLFKCIENSSNRSYHNNNDYTVLDNGLTDKNERERFINEQKNVRKMIQKLKSKEENKLKQTENKKSRKSKYNKSRKSMKGSKSNKEQQYEEIKTETITTTGSVRTNNITPSVGVSEWTENSVFSSNDNEHDSGESTSSVTNGDTLETSNIGNSNNCNVWHDETANEYETVQQNKTEKPKETKIAEAIVTTEEYKKMEIQQQQNVVNNNDETTCISFKMEFSFEFLKTDSLGNKTLINENGNGDDYDTIRLYANPIVNSRIQLKKSLEISLANMYFDIGRVSYPDSRVDGNLYIKINNPINEKGFYGDFNKNILLNRNNMYGNNKSTLVLSPRIKGTICGLMFELRINEQLNINMKYNDDSELLPISFEYIQQ